MVIKEVYIGRIPEVEDMFQTFCQMRKAFREKDNKVFFKEKASLEKKIESFWGFKAFSISTYTSTQINAMTYPVATSFDVNPEKIWEATKTGYRFKKEAKVASICKIASVSLESDILNDEEAFAMLLHEIGHSFTFRSPLVSAEQLSWNKSMISNVLLMVLLSFTPLGIWTIPQLIRTVMAETNIGKRISATANKFIAKIPFLRSFNIFAKADKWLEETYYKSLAKEIVKNREDKRIEKEINKKSTKEHEYSEYESLTRSWERLSDDFMNIYGFGPAGANMLVKFAPASTELISKYAEDDIGKDIIDKAMALSSELSGIFSEHPSDIDRILSLAESLKREIDVNKKLDPKIKAELAENYKVITNLIKDIKNKSNKLDIARNKYLQDLAAKRAKEGSSEQDREKDFFDRDEIDAAFDAMQVEEAVQSMLESFNPMDYHKDIFLTCPDMDEFLY